MRHIAIWSPKGGVGKTTLALSIASGLSIVHGHGHRVLLCDLDPQESAYQYALYAISRKRALPWMVIHGYPDERPDVDWLISDHAPGDADPPRADITIVPMLPGPLDYFAVQGAAAGVIECERAVRVINRVHGNRQEDRQVVRSMADRGAIVVHERSAHRRVLSMGSSIYDPEADDIYGIEAARGEVDAVLDRILDLGGK